MIAYFPYWYAILKNGTRPQRASWLIWIFSDTLVFSTSWQLGATDSLWVPGAYVIGTIITFFISIKRGEGGTSSFDYLCLVATAISGFLWWLTGNPFQSLMINLFIVAIGVVPSLKKIVKDPYSEDLVGFLFWMLGSGFSSVSVLFLSKTNIDIWIQPVWFFTLQLIVVSFIVIGRTKSTKTFI